ncbi:MAG: hypothetical protein H8E17_10170 [Deltaproteobacteria bacterium]|nr:hypothetical protein [Deltaproteobacteria bacterium]
MNFPIFSEKYKGKTNDLYVGIESGSDEVPARINKGNTIAATKEQMNMVIQSYQFSPYDFFIPADLRI